ncbi:MAG: hypothetical protein Q8867_01840 [Bacteroidota bacterium]|nr:hypothetical protein [Bacteroidota bacterium]
MKKTLNKLLLFIYLIQIQGLLFSQVVQQTLTLEEKALIYFCNNVESINKNLNDYKIKFSGKTTGSASNVYDIADCIGSINLIRDSIPGGNILDSLRDYYKGLNLEPKKLNFTCNSLQKRIMHSTSQNYSLQIFHAIEYKGYYFVEIFLANKKNSNWIVGVKFDRVSLEPISYCVKYFTS